jgi:hypothetical protein
MPAVAVGRPRAWSPELRVPPRMTEGLVLKTYAAGSNIQGATRCGRRRGLPWQSGRRPAGPEEGRGAAWLGRKTAGPLRTTGGPVPCAGSTAERLQARMHSDSSCVGAEGEVRGSGTRSECRLTTGCHGRVPEFGFLGVARCCVFCFVCGLRYVFVNERPSASVGDTPAPVPSV